VEHGLPAGTLWSVTLGGIRRNGTGPSLAFWDPNGDYSFRVGTVSGFVPHPAAGQLIVRGMAVGRTVSYTA